MGLDAPWHWIVLAIVIVALFGYKKLPDAARSVGRSLRVFKTEIKGMGEDDKAREAAAAAPKQLEQPLPQAVVQPVAQPVAQPVVQPVAQPVAPVTPPVVPPPVNVNGAASTTPAAGSQPVSE